MRKIDRLAVDSQPAGAENCGADASASRDRNRRTIVSAIVPAYGSPGRVTACVEALRAAREAPDEIIVVDDGTPGGLSVPIEGVRVIRHPSNRGPAAARNTGARAASGDWLLFVDSDILIDPEAPSRIRETLESRPEVSLTFGIYSEDCLQPGLVSQYKNLYWRHKFLILPPHTANLNTALMAVRREAFEAAGMFNEDTIIGEDRELGQAMASRGFRTYLDKQLLGTHCKRFGFRGLMREHFSSAVNAALLLMATPVGIRSEDREVLGASRAYLGSIAAAAAGSLLLGVGILSGSPLLVWSSAGFAALFVALNLAFIRACGRFRGWWFGFSCLGLALAESLVAAGAILYACLRYFVLGNPKRDFRLGGSAPARSDRTRGS